ncbi:mechanosensitive ion channel domain-containing protein [Paramagnetospirillum magneticum]|uniref:Small-conductance mechanosensitive channel n=1 Tax=Paramagnetospirillum magneticum (strain ATCC 700264 / AMB-1) TaxID=342108 RepID=Q2WAL0_PARM1|nr:mechanosensitive ion channel domain-containing protein [Paramagnetospirillum magneticum]BAE49115.1 Small-conductance mechanosensitive channel [Paramagnetospirillum magneticum AMB-1]
MSAVAHNGVLRRLFATVLLLVSLGGGALAQTAAPPAPPPALPAAVPELPGQINAIGDKAADVMVQKMVDHSGRDQWGHTAVIVVLTLAVAFGADRLSRGAWHRFAGRRLSDEQRLRIRQRLGWLRRILLGGLGTAVGLMVVQSLGVYNVLAVVGSEWGRRILSGLINIVLVLALAVVFWEVLRAAIERYLSATDSDGNQLQRSGRVRTLLPLVRNAAFIMLVISVGLIVLSEIGVNIAPLLAGAGVLGIAIGFGSQKLVQDIITGAFVLFEDTMAVGDAVKVGEHVGTVEAISIRAIKIRDGNGALHTVPFGAVSTVVNSSRGFNYAAMDIPVAYEVETDKAAAVITDLGAEMRAEAGWGAMMIDPVEVQGVERFDAASVVLRVRIKTTPGDRVTLIREFNRRLKQRFDAAGIAMSSPQAQKVVSH